MRGIILLPPINFKKWIEEHRHLLKPPVGNQEIWSNREFMVTVVGGPNARKDYHINEGEEFFYQIEGNIFLKIREQNHPKELTIQEGEIFLLPSRVPHSPQRPAGTIGLVIERRRLAHEKDGLVWYCEGCDQLLYEEYFHLKNLVTDLPPVFQKFYNNPHFCTCRNCGRKMENAKN